MAIKTLAMSLFKCSSYNNIIMVHTFIFCLYYYYASEPNNMSENYRRHVTQVNINFKQNKIKKKVGVEVTRLLTKLEAGS